MMLKIGKGPTIKNSEELELMVRGGEILNKIKTEIKNQVKVGTNAWQIEELTNQLIDKYKVKSSFKMVPGYGWATCVNLNEGIVHGIPKKETVFTKGDIVSVDMGVYYQGFHTDTSFSLALESTEGDAFLEVGKEALGEAIKMTKVGNRIYDISERIEKIITEAGYNPVRTLVGHGIGRNLHEEPAIPCFANGKRADTPTIVEGMALAIEVMYMKGSPMLKIESDGWTISTQDGKISALFEDTVIITKSGPKVIT